MDTQINKFAKMFVGLGNVQLIIGILEVAFNIGVNLITPWLLYTAYIGPGYWCGLFVSALLCAVGSHHNFLPPRPPFTNMV